jgi:pimeloyl-ACP methyl ester carboxylesterase
LSLFRIILSFALFAAISAAVWVPTFAGADDRCLRKELPQITWKNISPPFEDYSYFDNVKKFPFDYQSKTYSSINAWWMSEAATLVYSKEDFVGARFEKAGLNQLRFFDAQSTQCYLAYNTVFAVVVFRGSEIWRKKEKVDVNKVFADLKADVDVRLVKWHGGGKVHRGFKTALDEVWDDLIPHLEKLHRQGLAIWFGGHSLGAALATLAADRYPHAAGVYTIGSPRIGNSEFRDRYRVQNYRIVNNRDLVTRVPPRGIYRHVGELRFIDESGVVRSQMLKAKKAIRKIPNEPRDNYETDENFRGGLQGLVPDAFRDHNPLLYTVLLWNYIVDLRD